MRIHELSIQGMSCQHCVKSVREALLSVHGVTRAEVQIGHARVEAEDDVEKASLLSALSAADYAAS